MTKKRSSLIMARNERVMRQGIKTSKGTLKFNGASGMHVSDPGLVAEIESTVGLKGSGDVWTHQDEMLEHHKTYKEGRVHSYFFGPQNSPEVNEFWERYEKKKKAKQREQEKLKRQEEDNDI